MQLLKKYPRHNPLTASRLIEGEAVVLFTEKSAVKVLNKTGSSIWTLCDVRYSVEEIVKKISARYGVDANRAEHEILDSLAELREKAMIVLHDGKSR